MNALEQEMSTPLKGANLHSPSVESPTIHFSQLPNGPANGPLAQEWNLYRREIGRLVAEGQEGRWLLIKGDSILGIWNTEAEANATRLERFLHQSILMKQILEWEPILRGGGHTHRWLS